MFIKNGGIKMNNKILMLMTLILLSLLTIGAVSAAEDSINLVSDADDSVDLSVSESDDVAVDEDSLNDIDSSSIDDAVKNPVSQDLKEESISDEIESEDLKADNIEKQSNILREPSEDIFEVEMPDEVMINETQLGDENYICLIKITVPKDVKANITIYEEGKLYNRVRIASGSVDVDEADEFTHHVDNDKLILSFNSFARGLGEKNYKIIFNNGTDNITKTKVVKYDYELRADSVVAYGDTELEIRSAGNISKVTVYIDGKKYAINNRLIHDDHNFYYHYVKLPKLAVGTYKIKLTYAGDKNLPKKTVETTFKVEGVIKFNAFTFGAVKDNISLLLPKSAKGSLSVQIFDSNNKSLKTLTQKLVNGSAAISLYNKGVYGENFKVIAKYTGTDYDVADYEYDYVIINPTISVPAKMLVGEKKYVSINLPGKEGTLKVFIDLASGTTKTYTANLVGGKASISLSKLKVGDKIWFISFLEKLSNGSSVSYYYNGYRDFEILKPLNIVTNYTYYGGSVKIQAYKAGGKPLAYKYISIKINGKFFKKVKTNKNGIAKVKLGSKYTPKKYNITAVYGKNKVSKKIKVKQVLSLKKVTIKKSAKKLILTATLKKGKTPMKKRKVTFRFKGKKYTVKTNKKGIAKVTIKKSVLKKLKVGKKLTYKATYCKTTVKRTVKVKK